MNALRLFVIICALSSPLFAAETPRQVTWDDLTVKPPAVENPIERLSQEQIDAMAEVSAMRHRKSRGIAPTARDIAAERAAAEKLKQWGIDVDAVLAKREEIIRKVHEVEGVVNKTLDGKLIRLAGYVLPLEFSGKQVSEFLLVPWVGACIHTPPPPANQIVHVKTDKPVEVKGMFEPVWVTGKIAANAARKSLFLTDGAAEIDIGYSIGAGQVAPYSK